MEMQELKQLIHKGEKVDVECKEAENTVPKSVYESYSAFAFVNLIIHADYLLDAGTLKVIKRGDGFEFTNPGILKLPIEDIYWGGNSKPRNPRMQTMLRMIGFGDNAGSGFPAILSAWENEGWIQPELREDTRLNQVALILKMIPAWLIALQELRDKIIENVGGSETQIQKIAETLNHSIRAISAEKYDDMDIAIRGLAEYMADTPKNQVKEIAKTAKTISEKMPENENLVYMAQKLACILKKSAEKSAESAKSEKGVGELSKRQRQIFTYMQEGMSYSAEEVAQMIGLKGSRTRQLLNELVALGLVSCTAATKNRRYVKE